MGKILNSNNSRAVKIMTMKFSGFPILISIYHWSKFQRNLRRKGDIHQEIWMI